MGGIVGVYERNKVGERCGWVLPSREGGGWWGVVSVRDMIPSNNEICIKGGGGGL